MPSLQIKDVPVDIYERLEWTAKQAKRSVSEQVIVVLRSFFTTNTPATFQNDSAADTALWAEIDRRKRELDAGNSLTFDFNDLDAFTKGNISKEELLSRQAH